MKKLDPIHHFCSAINKLITEGGSKLKAGEEHAGLTSDMKGRWTIGAFDTDHANKDETPPIKENLIPDPNVLLGVDHDKKLARICAWCDKALKVTKHFHKLGYDTTHGICPHCTELMKRDAKNEGVIKLKPLLESEEDETPTWPDIGDVDKDFETGETNFPHGSGYPNAKKDYDKVVHTDSIYGVDDADMHKYNTTYAQKVIQYVNQHLPWVKGYFNEDNYSEHTEVWGVTSAVERVISNFRHWANEKEENVTRQGAPEWWSGMYKKAQRIVQEFPNVMQELEKYYKFLEFINDESPDNVENQENYPLHVTLYDVTRALGGQEEGGWWYDNNQMVKTFKVTSFAQAEKAAKLLYNEIQKADLDGQPRIVIEKKPGGENKEAPNYS